jgi:phosphoribosylamine--glycine ligase
MLTKEGPRVIEFNCRFGDPECQTLMPLMGPELARILQACALGRLAEAPPLTSIELCSACVVSAADGYPDAPRKGDPIEISLNVDQSEYQQLQLFHAGTRHTFDGVLETAGGRVLAMVAQATDFDQAFTKAYEGLMQVRYEGMQFRKDIGHQVRAPKLS